MKGKVIENKYGLQVVVDNEYYKVGKDAMEHFKSMVGQEVEFEPSTSEYQGKTYKWANMPKKQNEDKPEAENKEDESRSKGKTMLYALYLELREIFKDK